MPLKRFASSIGLPSSNLKYSFRAPRSMLDAEALALVHRAAGRRNFRIRLAEQRLESARFDHDQAGGIKRNVARAEEEFRRVPKQSRRLPRLHEFQLLGKTLRIGRRAESFLRQLRRGGVMPVRNIIFRARNASRSRRVEICGSPRPYRREFSRDPRCAAFRRPISKNRNRSLA